MSQVAKLFSNGRSQAVRLPAAYRFDAKEVFIHKDPQTGDVILSRKPANWDEFFIALKGADVPADFLGANERKPERKSERNQEREPAAQDRDPFKGWRE